MAGHINSYSVRFAAIITSTKCEPRAKTYALLQLSVEPIVIEGVRLVAFTLLFNTMHIYLFFIYLFINQPIAHT